MEPKKKVTFDASPHGELLDIAVKRVGFHPLAISIMAGAVSTVDELTAFVEEIKTSKIEKLQDKGADLPTVVRKVYAAALARLEAIPDAAACFEASLLLGEQHMPLSVLSRIWPTQVCRLHPARFFFNKKKNKKEKIEKGKKKEQYH